MSSANYKIQTDVLSQGGDTSTSTNYWANDAIGDLATGEDLSSTNYRGCSGFECFDGADYISFSVTAGTSAPGVAGDPIPLGTISQSAVTTSNGTTVRSAFVSIDSNGGGGAVVTVKSQNGGLAGASHTISSGSATLVAGTEGYGLCVFSTAEDSFSPSTLEAATPYDGSCTKTTGHAVGQVSTSAANILTTSDEISNGEAEILVKAAISNTTTAGNYADTLTFVATSTY